jgi:sugar (pentulose or hexulose) kinase
MSVLSVIAVFDIGRTNKKCFLFDEQYHIVWEQSVELAETEDEDGFPCEDIHILTAWVKQTMKEVLQLEGFAVKAVNFSAHGASFVYINEQGQPVGHLYNYLKPYPAALQKKFYSTYGGEQVFSLVTASPVLGSLNSGLQVYRVQKEKPELYEQVQYALHLPQYISYLVTGKPCAEITSIGCHTGLWHFSQRQYHEWVYEEKLDEKFPSVLRSDAVLEAGETYGKIKAGVGLHDSSAALVPYLASFTEPFVLLSTGTWCISLNPFNKEPLRTEELERDCLSYLSYQRQPVKASRLFAGQEHELQVKRLAKHFAVAEDHYRQVGYDTSLQEKVFAASKKEPVFTGSQPSAFGKRNLNSFSRYEEAYHQLISDIMQQQQYAISLILSSHPPSQIFVDGGFAQNTVFMHMLAASFPAMKVYAAAVSQASSLGAALVLHAAWNKEPLRSDLVALTAYSQRN